MDQTTQPQDGQTPVVPAMEPETPVVTTPEEGATEPVVAPVEETPAA